MSFISLSSGSSTGEEPHQIPSEGSCNPPTPAAVPLLVAASADEWRFMKLGYAKLFSVKCLMYPHGINSDTVNAVPALRRFVCWSCVPFKGCGVSQRRSGGPRASADMFYWQVSVSKDLTFQAQKLSLCVKVEASYRQFALDSSHLCHNRLCWNPDHLHAESHLVNMSRNTCPSNVFVRDVKKVFCFCTHVPPCLRLRIVNSLSLCEVIA